ncbi:unnamed protein product [Symbiodinium natans]|uniref:Pentatricopeptide repeat-containing protein, chloroplastic n=1 Tax=Symbiodinium natans TaxID=878477 RepID=A0A812TCI0_9DINO|nr:unnamed protein product [Symbiodinium natans]
MQADMLTARSSTFVNPGCSPKALGRFDSALPSFAWQSSVDKLVGMQQGRLELTVVSYTSAMAQMAWIVTLKVLAHMQERQCLANSVTLNSILAATARSAQWTSGMCLLREMQSTGLVPTIISFGTGLSFGRGARWRQGFRLLQQLWRISLQLNTVAANAAISCVSPGMSMSGNEEMLPRGWSAAIHMHSRMRQRSIEVSAATTGSLIQVGRFTRRWHLALGFLKLEQQLRGDRHPSVSRISANTAISACEVSQWARALGVCESMEGVIDGVTVSACISACEKGHRWERAVDLTHHLSQGTAAPRLTGLAQDKLQCLPVALTACISACEKGCAWQTSLQMAADLRPLLGFQKASQTLPYNAALCSLGRSARWELAVGIVSWLHESTLQPSLETLNACVGALRVAQEWSCALAAWLTLKQWALLPSVVTLAASLATVSGRAACNALISVCAEPQRWSLGICLFDVMAPDRISFNSLASVLEKSRRWRQTLALLPQLRSRRLEPDPFTQDAILAACQRAGVWRRVLASLHQTPSPEVVGMVCAALALARQWEQWPKVLEMLQDLRARDVEVDAAVQGMAIDLLMAAGAGAPASAPYVHSLHLLLGHC